MCFDSGGMSSNLTPSESCERCGLHYPKGKDQCPYCVGMSDSQEKEHGKNVLATVCKQNSALAKIFIYGAVLSLIILLLSFS